MIRIIFHEVPVESVTGVTDVTAAPQNCPVAPLVGGGLQFLHLNLNFLHLFSGFILLLVQAGQLIVFPFHFSARNRNIKQTFLLLTQNLPDVFNPFPHVTLGLTEVLVDQGGADQLEDLGGVSGEV